MKNYVALSIHRGQCRNVLKPSEAFLSSGSSKREMFLWMPPFLELMVTNYIITLLHEIVQTITVKTELKHTYKYFFSSRSESTTQTFVIPVN